MGFVNLKFKPDLTKQLLVTFYCESKLPLVKAAEEVAAESSIGTWTELKTLKKSTQKRLAAQVYWLDEKKKLMKIAYPLDLFELNSIPQLLSSIAGNIFSMKKVDNLRLLDIEFPTKYINSYQGPKWGIPGIRKLLKIKERPLLGCIMKPKIGLSASENAKLAYQVWKNGIDVIKDDENLTNMVFNNFYDRVRQVLKLQKQVEKETGQKKIYVFNVTGTPDVVFERADFVRKAGGDCVMLDIVSTGLDNVQMLRKANLGLIIHGHRAGHSMFTRDKKHGMTMYVLAKLARLAGIDQLHTGTVVGKMEGGKDEVLQINKFLHEDWGLDALKENWSKIKPVMPIASGGLHPGLTEKLVKILGYDVIINFGGGIHGHPKGSQAGARAAWQSVEAVMKGISAKKYAQTHKELAQALKLWGE